MNHFDYLCLITRRQVDEFDPDWKLGPGDRSDVHMAMRAVGNGDMADAEDMADKTGYWATRHT